MTSATSDNPAPTMSSALRARAGAYIIAAQCFSTGREGVEEYFRARGSAQVLEKARNGQGNPRKNKPFSWIVLAGLGPIWLNLVRFGSGLGPISTRTIWKASMPIAATNPAANATGPTAPGRERPSSKGQAGKVRRPAAPDSRPNRRRAPVASQLSALIGPSPGSRTGISAASARRHNSTAPSA